MTSLPTPSSIGIGPMLHSSSATAAPWTSRTVWFSHGAKDCRTSTTTGPATTSTAATSATTVGSASASEGRKM
jgi:hypothetical protein